MKILDNDFAYSEDPIDPIQSKSCKLGQLGLPNQIAMLKILPSNRSRVWLQNHIHGESTAKIKKAEKNILNRAQINSSLDLYLQF